MSTSDPKAAQTNTYDAVPYSVHSFPQTHPNRLAVMAALFGMAAQAPDRCRVLELGCASGGNLIPMALSHPESEFLGIDLSLRQIEDGNAIVGKLGLKNLQLRHLSIMDIGPEAGTFDYVLAHGVYSWVPPAVQDKILEICSKNLAPQGVAYVSYNCYPGWHARGAIREMLWYHTERFKDPVERIGQARALLGFLVGTIPEQDIGYAALIRQELGLLLRTPDSYLLHEHLEEFNEPLYFHQFAGRAMAKGLQYLGEAQLGAMVASRFGPEAEKTLRALSPDLLHMEQYMDFIRNRMFRQTLLCHAAVGLEHTIRTGAVAGFHVASAAKAAAADAGADAASFALAGRPTLTTRDPLMKAAMGHLAEQWPRPVPFGELYAAACGRIGAAPTLESQGQLQARLLNCHASHLVDFSIAPAVFSPGVSERPVACPYARLRAANAENVTNRRLEAVGLTQASRLVLALLDGQHDRAAIIDRVTAWLESLPSAAAAEGAAGQAVESPRDRATAYVDHLLPMLAQNALLIG